MKNFLAGLSILILLGVGCMTKGDIWQGFYYPDGCLACEDSYIYSPVFHDSLSCLNWAYDYQRVRGGPEDLWECGKNCEMDDDYGLYVCEETID